MHSIIAIAIRMDSPDLKAIRKAIWYGSIPCRILLDPGESRVFDASDPYYVCSFAYTNSLTHSLYKTPTDSDALPAAPRLPSHEWPIFPSSFLKYATSSSLS